jgi:hypothetical protein
MRLIRLLVARNRLAQLDYLIGLPPTIEVRWAYHAHGFPHRQQRRRPCRGTCCNSSGHPQRLSKRARRIILAE